MRISNVEIIYEFVNDGRICGVYSVLFNGEKKVFIRNSNSIGVVAHYLGKSSTQCVSEIRDDVKKEFFHVLNKEANNE